MTKILKRPLSILLAVLMIAGIFTALPLTAYAAPTETLLTTITGAGSNAITATSANVSYSTEGVATLTFSGVVSYQSSPAWGWWGYGWTATVTPADGYTITKCVFYDDANRTATDSEAPFVVETTEEDKTPQVNGTPMAYTSKGIKKIEVYGYAAPAHTHTWDTAWTKDATYHWHACTGEGATDACLNETGAAKAEHTYGDTGDARFTCTVCEYVDTTKQAEAEAADLAAAKTAAKADLDTLLDGKTEADYDADDWTTLTQAIANGKTAIDNATTINDVATAKSNTETSANAVKTTAEKLADAKTAAKADLDTLLDGKTEADYDADDWTTLTQAIANGKTAIDNATTINDVATAKSNAEASANAVKTTAEKKEEADTAAANGVSDTINNLPAANEVTTANKNAIEAARKAYNDLTDDQKAKVDAETLKKLTDAEDALKAAGVSDTINALPAAADVTTADKDNIEAARAAYDALTNAQKGYVSADTLKNLTDAEDALAAAGASDTINALPAASNVTTADKDDIEAARAAYDALTNAQKGYVSADTLKKLTDAEDALAAAGVSDTINALPAASDVTTADKDTIEAARKAYNDLTDDQKGYVSADTLKKLTDAEEALEVAETVAKINALPASDNVKTTDKADIEAARKAYDDLTDDQKAKVSEDTLKKLTDAESALEVAETVAKINALPAADDVKTTDKTDIEAARTAYDALTADQKAKVSENTLKKLTDAESTLAVAEVNEAINALPDADNVTVSDKDAIEAARKAYNDLTDDQKAKVSEDTLKKLTDAESAFTVASVSEKINALPDADKVTTADKEAIEEARGFYDALTDAQKTKVSEDTLKKLTDAEAALKDAVDTAAANTVSETINALPDADKVTTADKDAIEAARKAYDDLTDDQKAKVDAETLKKLTDAEAALKDAVDTAAANTVSEAINALPDADKVTTADKDAIEAARKAYDDLTDDQKAKVNAETLKKLTDAETALAKEEADTKAANDVTNTINALPDADKVTTADKDAIEAARKAYDDLTDDQKAKVDAETLKKLTDAETALAKEEADTKAANDVTNTINALPDADKVTTADKDAIEAARKDYDDLTDDQKAKVDAETLKKLTDAETALAKEEADTKAANDVTNTINALPDADKVTTANKDAIEAARKAYDDLTDDQKAKVDAETLKKLTDAEAALKDAVDTAAANTASEAINALPDADKVTTADKDAIEAARKAYDDLTDDQKAKVDAETLKKLTDAETALAAAEKQAADEEQAAKELAAAKTNAQKAMNNQVTVTQKGKKITVKWSKSTAADGYQVFAQYCGKKTTKPVKTIKKNTTTKVNITKINGKKINLKKQFKVFVKAYKVVNGKKVTLAKSIVGHVVGVKNAKYTNVKSIKVTKSKLTVKVGKTAKVKAKVTLVDKNKKHIPKSHAAKFRYRTSNKKIATVTKSGKIKGIKKGTCTIYVYAINGKMKKVKVTVK